MRKLEGVFFLIWGIATLFASLVVTLLLLVTKLSYAGVFWVLVPVVGLTGTALLIRYCRGRHRLFGEAKRAVAALWMFVGPGIGFVGFDSSSPLVAKLILLGIGVAVTGRLVNHRITMIVGIVAAFSSLVLYQLPSLYQPIAFGLITLVAMSLPWALVALCPESRSSEEQSIAQDA